MSLATNNTMNGSEQGSVGATDTGEWVCDDGDVTRNHGNKPVSLCCSYRLFMALCGTLAMCVSFASQTSMSSAIVCMAKPTDHHNHTFPHQHNTLPMETNMTSGESESWRLDWDSETKGWVVASFFIGYYIMQIPSGIIVSKFGPKTSMVLGSFTTAMFHLLTIPVARWNLPVLYVIRFLAGISCGCMLPGIYALVANWAPRQETSMMFAIAGSGLEIGNSFCFLVSLIACNVDFQGGWPIIFYTLAFLQILLGLIMLLFMTNFPSTNRYISMEESKYITDNSVRGDHEGHIDIPYCKILTSLPVWAFLFAELGSEWMYYMIATQTPLFLVDILQLTTWKINLLISLPFLSVIPLVYVVAFASDRLVERRIFTNTTVRKLHDAISKIFPGVLVVILGFLPVGAWSMLIVVYFLFAIGIVGMYIGYLSNPADLSPSHTGFISGLGQGTTNWVAFLIPILTGYLTHDKDRHGWQTVFYITAALQAFCLLCFLLFGSGELQPWANTAAIDEKTPIKPPKHNEVNERKWKH